MEQQTMKALLWAEDKSISIIDAPVPKIIKPTDAIVKVTLSTICASDIHIVGGHTLVKPPQTIGHEFCGEVVELGSAVAQFKPGDKVAVSCLPYCGQCYFCQQGLHYQCLDPDCTCFGTNMGDFAPKQLDGCQAEYVRIPYADNTLYKIPEGYTEEDMLFVGDILSTGYFAAEKANIKPGDTVLIIGAGPVGMCAAICAKLWGPSKIIISDGVQSRLDVCLKEGIVNVALNPTQVDVTAKCLELTGGLGPDVVLECIGLQPTLVQACQAVRMGGNVVTIGVYGEPVTLPMQEIWFKNISISMGFVPMNHMAELIKLIESGTINTKFLMTHRAPLNDIVKGYDVFGNKKDNCLKWIVTPYEK